MRKKFNALKEKDKCVGQIRSILEKKVKTAKLLLEFSMTKFPA